MAVAAIGEVIVEAIKVTAEAAKMGARALAEVGKSMGKASANMARTMVRDFKAGGDATKDVGAEPKAANPTRLHANDVNGVKNPTPEGVSENVGRSPE
ncbi:MAG: hypothetical protein J2P36_39345, partial [Ktedonobacteraceae bacterium]|nr:hypothetical protein [Ktedonobacteraceae bacterium]